LLDVQARLLSRLRETPHRSSACTQRSASEGVETLDQLLKRQRRPRGR